MKVSLPFAIRNKATCSRKIRYGHLSTALKACRVMEERRGAYGLTAYPCPHCKGFHIGHAPGFEITVEMKGGKHGK